MKIRTIYLLTAFTMLIACNDNAEKPDETKISGQHDGLRTTMPADNPDTTIGGCYSQVFNQDTVMLQIQVKEKNVTGPLTYKLYQKDFNDGSIKAVVEDSLITGWYLFRSEGILSVRQVAWRIKPGQLWPAMGEVMQRNDTSFFAKPDQLQYDGSRALLKVTCTL